MLLLSIVSFTLYEKYEEARTIAKLNAMTPADKADNLDEKINTIKNNGELTADDYAEIGSLYQRRGHLLHKEDELYKAIESYEKALELDPTHSLAVHRMGNILHVAVSMGSGFV